MPLRPLAEKDLPLVRGWRNAPEVRRNMYSKHEITEAEHLDWFARLRDDAQSRWFIHEDAAGQPAGVVYFTQIQRANGSVFWGFYAGENAVRGIGTHMEFEALEKAFYEFGLHKLNCEVLVSNGQVVNLHKKFGFKEEGLFRDFHFNGESYVDVVRLGILAAEWSAKREEIQNRIAKLDALSVAKIVGGGYKIMILSDRHSWIAPYLDELAEEWAAAGHDCQIAHKVSDIEPADFCFCLSFSQILPAIARSQFKNTLVVHESDLPKGRGWAPMTWQILEGSTRIPVTLLEAVDAVDAGPIYLQEWIDLEGTELNQEWRKLQAETTLRLCAEWVRNYPAVLGGARDQVGVPSFYPRRRPEHSQLDISKSLTEHFDLLRVVDNEAYPAFFEWQGKRYVLRIEKSLK
jgi:methionyl-tRNA formyltransferase